MERLELAREAVFLNDVLAEWLFAVGRPTEAARTLGVADSARAALGTPLMPQEREELARLRASIVGTIGEDETKRAIRAGAGLSKEQGLAEAKRLLASVQPG